MLTNAVNRARGARNEESGFTLIELLIVIVILGVLAGIVVFSVRGISSKGEASACKADKATVETAVEAYYAQKSSYPTAIGTDSTSGATTLTGSGLLRSAPSSDKYAITLGSNGAVTAAPDCATLN